MTKPQLNIRAEIGLADTPSSAISAVTWTDITAYLRPQDGINLTRGRQDETSQVGAGVAAMSFNNRDGRFTPGNTSGAYYPNVKLRRPLRISRCDYDAEALLASATLWLDANYASSSQTVPNQGTGGTALDATLGSTGSADSNDPKWLPYEGDPYVYLPGVAGNYLSVPDSTALDITGDIDIRVKVALDDWTPASAQMLVAKEDEGSQRSYWLALQTDGTLVFHWSSTGAYLGTYAISTVVTGITDGSVKWVKVTRSSSSGDVKFYLSDDATTWTQLGTTVTSTPSAIFNSTTAVTVGAAAGGFMAAGKFYRAIVKNGIDGTTVLDIDTSVLTSGAATSFTATTGQTVTINRSTSGRKSVAVVGNCWLLGTDDYIKVPDNALLDFGASDSFTVVAVVRQWATPASDGIYASKYSSVGTLGYFLGRQSTGADARLVLGDGSAVVATAVAASSGSLDVLVGVRNTTADTLTMTANGAAGTAVADTTTGTLANTYPFQVGRREGTTNYQDFELVAVAVFRSALTAAQISAISTYFATRTATTTTGLTPYKPVWTGYVNGYGNGWNNGVQPFARVTASDLWAQMSRRTMKALTVEEQLYDNPALYFPLNDSAGSTTAGDQSDYARQALAVGQVGSGGSVLFGQTSSLGADPDEPCVVLTRSDASNGYYLTQSYNPLPELAAVSGVTLECYVYLPVAVSGTVRLLELSHPSSATILAVDLAANVPVATITLGSTVTATHGAAINDGAWHHVAAWYNGTSLRVYVDGSATTSAAALGTLTATVLSVGGTNTGTTLANAWVSGVAAYGSALAAARITAHAAGVTGATGDTSLARFNRIARLALGTWAESTSTETPAATMCAQPFAGQTSASLMQQVADAEGTPVFIGPDGVPVWQARGERTATAASVSIPATHVDSSTGFDTNDQLVLNSATYSRPGGSTVTFVDTTSADDYGLVSDPRTLYVDTDAQLSSAAARIVNSRSEPQTRTGALSVDLVTADATVPASTLLPLDIGDVLSVTSVPLGSTTTVDVFIEGVNDYINQNAWRRTWNTSPLRAGGQVWILGDPTYSILGLTTIAG